MSVTFAAKLPRSVPESAAVYALLPARASATALRSTAKALRLPGPAGDLVTAKDLVALDVGRYQLEVFRASGAVVFTHRDKYGIEPEKDFELSDRQAGAIARSFLGRSKLVPLADAKLAAVTHMHSASADLKSGRVQERITDAGVVYRRMIDKLPVDGPGGFAMVTVDPEGEVIALRSVWRARGKRLATVKLKSPDEALALLERRAKSARGDVIVTKATFGYFELGPLDAQKAIQPAYSFVYVVQTGEVALKSALVVPAGDRTFGPLVVKKRFKAPQTERKEG